MIDTLRPPPSPQGLPSSTAIPGHDSSMVRELRELARNLAGRLDRDAVPSPEERALEDAIDAAVTLVLPQIVSALDAELTPRLESLPLHTRLALLNARRRGDLGFD